MGSKFLINYLRQKCSDHLSLFVAPRQGCAYVLHSPIVGQVLANRLSLRRCTILGPLRPLGRYGRCIVKWYPFSRSCSFCCCVRLHFFIVNTQTSHTFSNTLLVNLLLKVPSLVLFTFHVSVITRPQEAMAYKKQ